MTRIEDLKNSMIRIFAEQMQDLGARAFRERLRASLARNDIDFASMPPAAQHEFVAASHEQAQRLGLRSEQAVAAYALGALWLGVGLEESSPLLERLLSTSVPEVRKVHAMSEWVRDHLGANSTPAMRARSAELRVSATTCRSPRSALPPLKSARSTSAHSPDEHRQLSLSLLKWPPAFCADAELRGTSSESA